MKRLALFLVVVAVAALAPIATAAGAPAFTLGFEALASRIPEVAGTPIEEEHYGANGDSLQQTTTGLMVWRKADNWTAFTNGSRTWINGPYGVQDRENEARFEWEPAVPAVAAPSAAVLSSPVPAVSPTPAPPSPPAPQSPEAAAEIAALDMINRSRQENGVSPLVMDETLRQVARAHARDISVHNYFGHVNPDGLQPWDRAKAAGISYSTMAENLGWSMGYSSPADGVRSNHQAMMAETSPNDGHRVNILNSRLKKIGIGVYRGADGKVFYVTDFVG